jgi:hypothetical protein
MNFGITFDVESPFGCDVFYVVEERLMDGNVKDAKVPEICTSPLNNFRVA